MEDVYTIKVKTKPDTRNLYPSERRYSASTVSGLAWVHIALAATSFLLACLALVSPNSEITTQNSINQNGFFVNGSRLDTNVDVQISNDSKFELNNNVSIDSENGIPNSNDSLNQNGIMNLEDDLKLEYQNCTTNTTDGNDKSSGNYMLVLAPGLITIFGLAAGIASFFASIRWYIDRNITWLFIISTLSTLVSLISFIMIIVWFIVTSEAEITDFYKDKDPFKDYFVIKHTDIVIKNESHIVVALNTPLQKEEPPNLFTKRVLSINILIAAFLELLWSILTVKIAYKGMRNNYKEDVERRGNCISVVTKIKGNDTRKMPRNGKPHKTDLIDSYPNRKIKRIFLAQSDNGFYLKNQQNKTKQNTETSSEIYKERMMNFLNRCASLEGMSNPERTPSIHSEAVLNTIPEVVSIDVNLHSNTEKSNRMTPVSWGDTPDHTIYNQNTLNLDKIFNFAKQNAVKSDSVAETQ